MTRDEKFKTTAAYEFGILPANFQPLVEYREPTPAEACIAWCKGCVVLAISFGGALGLALFFEHYLGMWSVLPSIFVVPCWLIVSFDWLSRKLFRV